MGYIVICSNIECSLGIIACSLPPLRKLFNHYYGSSHDASDIGTVRKVITMANSYPLTILQPGSLGSYGTKLVSLTPRGTFRSAARIRNNIGDEWDPLDDDDSNRRGIV